ncbi:MAG: hypothetical protein AAF741_19540, partial [Bacteroidota bacterium]
MALVSQTTTLDINATTNNIPITQVVYEVGGMTVVQNTEAPGTGVAENTNGPVIIKSMMINDGGTPVEIEFFNIAGSMIDNNNLGPTTLGVGVFSNGTRTTATDPNFEDEVDEVVSTTDILDYIYYDPPISVPSGPDFTIIFEFPLLEDDYVVVQERFGNSTFILTPVDVDGNPISGANQLRFQSPYDWNSGYASSSYITDQPFWYTVADVNKFYEGTTTSFQPVYGYQIDNPNEADVKFFGVGDNTFVNNECPSTNPTADIPTASIDCNSGNSTVTFTNIMNADRFGVSTANAGIYNGPVYGSATSFSGTTLTINGLTPSSNYIVRLYNQQEECLEEFLVTTPAFQPFATAEAGPNQSVCESSPTVTLAGSFGGAATTARWNGGNGTFNPNRDAPGATYTPTATEINAGSVTLTLITDDPSGPCPVATDNVTIFYIDDPDVTTQNVTVCEGTSVNLNDQVINLDGGILSFHATEQQAIDNAMAIAPTTVMPGIGTTTYFVRSTEASSGEDCFSVASFTVTVVAEPTISTSNLTVCEDTQIDLLDRVENPSSFT